MQKYIHLIQIVETEKVAANQLRTQLEDQDTEIERLKAEVRHVYAHSLQIYTLCDLHGVISSPGRILMSRSRLRACTDAGE